MAAGAYSITPIFDIPRLDTDRSFRRCNRTRCDAILRFQSAAWQHLRGGSDPADNFQRLFATSRTPVGSPPPPVDDSRRFDTKISAARDWRLPVRHHIESVQTASAHPLVIEFRPKRFLLRSSLLHPAPADR